MLTKDFEVLDGQEVETVEETIVEKDRPAYTNKHLAHIEDDEAEVAALEEERRKAREAMLGRGEEGEDDAGHPDDDPAPDDDDLDPEEQTFKKRYGDLRRYVEKMKADNKKALDDLKRQLTEATKQQIQLPKSDDEVAAWAQEYPDVAAIIETVATKKAREADEALNQRLEALEEELHKARREKAEVELKALHPDFDDLRRDPKFHEWAKNHPKGWVREALYENTEDAQFAADAIDLYKAKMGITTKAKAKDAVKRSREAAEAAAAPVTKGGAVEAPNAPGRKPMIRESEIMKMTEEQFMSRVAEIDAARREGRIILDVSGGR